MSSDISTGTTITASGSSSTQAAAWEVVNIEIQDSWTREAVDFTHLKTTGGREFKPSDLYDPGSMTVTVLFDSTTVLVPSPAAETWTVTFPGGETFICSGFITSVGIALPLEDRMVQTFTIKMTGDISGTILS